MTAGTARESSQTGAALVRRKSYGPTCLTRAPVKQKSRGARLIYGTFRPKKEPMPPANEFLDPVYSQAAMGAITHQQPIPKN